MPAKSVKSGLGAKYGAGINTAVNEHKDAPIKLTGGDRLPPGIEGGIAQLTMCKFDEYKEGDNKGEYFYHQRAVVVRPVDFNGARLAGSQFSKTEPCCDTKKGTRKTQSEHIGWIMNELKKLGWQPPKDRACTADDLEAAAAALTQQRPHFKFRTSALPKTEIVNEGGKWFAVTGKNRKGPYLTEQALKVANPYAGGEGSTYEDWQGYVEFNGEVTEGFTDNTAADGEVDQAPAAETNGEMATDEVDLDALAIEAGGDDGEPAILKLKEIANGVGITDEEITATESWEELVGMIRAKQEGDGAPPWSPAVGQVVLYKPAGNDPATKKPYKKAVEHKVTKVNEEARTCHLTDVSTKKAVLGSNKKPLDVSFDDVSLE